MTGGAPTIGGLERLNTLTLNNAPIVTVIADVVNPVILNVVPGQAIYFDGTLLHANGVWVDDTIQPAYSYGTNVESISFDNIVGIKSSTISFVIDAEQISFPVLKLVGTATGTLSPGFGINSSIVESLSCPVLQAVAGQLMVGGSSLTSADFSSLKYTFYNLSIDGAASLQSISFPSYVYCGGDLLMANCGSLTTASFPSIQRINGKINDDESSGLTALENFSLGSGLKYLNGDVFFGDAPLNQVSVDGILVRLAALNGLNGTTSYDNYEITLNAVGASPPSAAGLAAITVLEGRGNTVNVNS